MTSESAEYEDLESRILAALRPDLHDAEFNELALAIHGFQRRHNEPFRRWCATQPEPQHWREIPAVPQSIFKRYQLRTFPAEAAQKIFRTSGTTGEMRGEHWFLNTRLYDAAIVRGWDLLRLPEAVPIILAPMPEQAPFSSLSHMFGVLARERFTAPTEFVLDADGSLKAERFLRAAVRCFHAQRPVALLGTALAFLNLFEQLGGCHTALPPGSYAMETGGFKGSGREIAKGDLYAQFTSHFEMRADDVLNEYGMTELSSQCYARGVAQPHHAPPWLRALVIDPVADEEVPPGTTGVLRIFDLANLGSVLALQTQDLAIRRDEGFELLGRDPAALPRGCSRAADEAMRS